MDKIELFHNLVHMAAVDGKFTEEEIHYLVGFAERWEISGDEFETAMAGVASGGIAINLPPTHELRVELLRELILMMAADGKLSEEEKLLCARTSANMGLTTECFKELVNQLLKKRG
ncbi:MAG TPA: hypothetical protein PKD64_06400 [Pirellulaceae bacterium]|nr:hypothetical protein [Pirellulaceae bacterium]HMO91812.1 hypothetical protein [Pirellulaceae bacterium]HMP69875.1 hypothetical protein [Pirellulaceae bacterium]